MSTIPAGYKQTEVGVIPESWKVRPFGELATTVASGRSKVGATYGKYAVHGSTGVIGFCEEPEYEGDAILVARVGANAGKLNTVAGKYGVTDNTIILRVRSDSSLPFFYRQLESKRLNNLVFGSGQPLITGSQLKALVVCEPPLPEQRAIAAALSDVDALLAKLDQLIAKKCDLKQAAMQQLLTGQTRLPGFGGAWEVKRLGDVLERIVGGGTPSRSVADYWGGDIPWVTVKDFATFNPRTAQETITPEGLRSSSSNSIPSGTLITSTRMALGKAVVYEVDVSINQDLKALFPKANVSTKFLYYWFEHNATAIDELGSGSTVKGISLGDLKTITFLLSSLKEQTAIAAVLSDIDAELAALEVRRDKTRALKQGMMQELLTGRIRLVKPNDELDTDKC